MGTSITLNTLVGDGSDEGGTVVVGGGGGEVGLT